MDASDKNKILFKKYKLREYNRKNKTRIHYVSSTKKFFFRSSLISQKWELFLDLIMFHHNESTHTYI